MTAGKIVGFTPGPWTALDTGEVFACENGSVLASDLQICCTVAQDGYEEEQANARLIAEAPTMLATIEQQAATITSLTAEVERRADHFSIGDEVEVIPGCAEWAEDWRNTRLWIAGVLAVAGGGFDYWVCDAWPMPKHAALTDHFYVGVDGKPNMLSLVTTAAIQPTDTE
jgi:hypothetical protein